MRKILGFDSWTGGARYYQRLLPAMSAKSMQLTLAHIGSWGNDPGRPVEMRLGEMVIRDIAYYGGSSLESILDVERPDAVVLLSTDTFAHRAFIRYCKHRGIPTLNLYHGLVNIADNNPTTGTPTVARVTYIRYILSKAAKLLRYTLPCYSRALLKTGATRKDWNRFISDIFRMAKGTDLQLGEAAQDSRTTKCAVYVRGDAEHAMQCYGFAEDDVLVVGCPDLIDFGLKQSDIGRWQRTGAEKSVMYIETGYSSIGVYYSGTQGFVRHLIDTSNKLAAQGFKMLLKLKPGQVNTEAIRKSLDGTQIELVTNDNFLRKLGECSACIVEVTTLALLPALMGMPLLLAKYGSLSPLSFGPILTSYPRSYPLTDATDVTRILLNAEQTSNRNQLNEWISLNLGPLPLEKMPNRVVEIIEQMIIHRDRPSI